MRKLLMVELLAAGLLAGCMVGPGPRGTGAVIVVPALPSIVVLETEPYYQHGGYFYFYRGNSWSYSRSKSGPWVELPRDRYPREVKYKNRDRDRDRDQGEKREHDKQDRD